MCSKPIETNHDRNLVKKEDDVINDEILPRFSRRVWV